MAIAIAVGLVTSEIILAWFGAGAPGRRCQPLLSQRAVVHFASLRTPERLARQLKRQTHKLQTRKDKTATLMNEAMPGNILMGARAAERPRRLRSLKTNEPSPQNSRSTIV